jgi:hypothetical protein
MTMRYTLLSLLLLPLYGVLVAGPAACDEKKSAAVEKLSAIDLANLKLASSQMENADQAFALAKRQIEDSQRSYAEAMKRRDAILAKQGITPDQMAQKTVSIGDDGTITRASTAPPPKKK